MRASLLLVLAATLAASDQGYETLDARAMLGVHMSPPSPATQFENGTTPQVGVEALYIYQGTAAANMGIAVGDLILTVNGGEIGMMNDLRHEVALTGVGGEVTVEILRDGKKLTLTDTIGKWPEHIPFQPLDEDAERRFRAWQDERWNLIDAAANQLAEKIGTIEQQPWAKDGQREPLAPRQIAALQRLPAFRLRLRAAHDSSDRRRVHHQRQVAWDARVLLGTSAPDIY